MKDNHNKDVVVDAGKGEEVLEKVRIVEVMKHNTMVGVAVDDGNDAEVVDMGNIIAVVVVGNEDAVKEIFVDFRAYEKDPLDGVM
eukprot:m.139067 g.139067  ORF g.139067 m.139067 type:complete len:85 (+) comp18764_c0_seq1:187-441(+)